MGVASVTLTHLTPKAAVWCEIGLTRNDSHWAVQGHRLWYQSKAPMRL